MDRSDKKWGAFIVSVFAVLCATAGIIAAVVSLGSGKIEFEAEFYMLYYSRSDEAVSADGISEGVVNFGGAGYVFCSGGQYYVAVACYFSGDDATKVQKTLAGKGYDCGILKLQTGEYKVSGKKDEKLYIGNLKTLYSLAEMCYCCANGLDDGTYDQTAALGILGDVESCLQGLKKANGGNAFFGECERLITQKQTIRGYIYSKEVRALQIAIVDTIVNIDLQ